MSCILTLDLGTTYFKAALFDRAGRMLAIRRVAPPIEHPAPGAWELAPQAFKATVARMIAELRGEAPTHAADITALSFATQTNSFLLLDAGDRPLTPILLWPDTRGNRYAPRLAEMAGDPDFVARTGIPQLTAEFMLAKLMWLRDQQPMVYAQARRLCLLSDYLTLWLTGQHVTEAGAFGLTGLLNIHRLEWLPDIATAAGVEREWLPQITRAGADLGPLLPSVCEELSLPTGCRFIVGCLDQYAGAVGAGNLTPGGVSETTGTVLAAVRCSDRFIANAAPGVYQGPAATPGAYYQMSFGNASANLLEAYRNRLPDRPEFTTLDSEAAHVPAGAEGLRLPPPANLDDWPALLDAAAHRYTRGHIARAIMETVADRLARQIDTLCGGSPPGEIRSTGGAARSDLWLQIKADVLNRPVIATVCPEPTSLGAALLAATGLAWGTTAQLANEWVKTRPPKWPDPQRHAVYREVFSAG